MGKIKYRSGVCVHCLQESDKINDDHVFPESWYPDSTPKDLEKWKVPSCECCNSRYGNMEREMLHRLGLCLDPKDIAALGITDKVHRAMDGSKGKSDRDKRARAKEREKILKDIIDVPPEHTKGIYPSLQPAQYPDGETRKGILVPAGYFDRLTEKIVRGITFVELKEYIDKKYRIKFSALPAGGTNPVLENIMKFGTVHHRGPGILARVARVPDEQLTSAWYIDIWQHFRMYALCFDEEARKERMQEGSDA